MFSGTTVSYHKMQASNDQLMSSIFQLHIENFTKILNFMASFLLIFFVGSILLDAITLVSLDISSVDYLSIFMWIFKEIVNIFGIVTAIFCIVAVYLQSRGSSLKFASMISFFAMIYFVYLAAEIGIHFDNIQNTLKNKYGMTRINAIYFLLCLLIVLAFFMKFFISKSRQYHTIVTQAILENTKQSLKNIDGSLKFEKGLDE